MSANLFCIECCASLCSRTVGRENQEEAHLTSVDTGSEHARSKAIEDVEDCEEHLHTERVDDLQTRNSEEGNLTLIHGHGRSEVEMQQDYPGVYRDKFLGYPKERVLVSRPSDVQPGWSQESVCIGLQTDLTTKEEWDGTFDKLVQSNCVKDLDLDIQLNQSPEASPDFAKLLECPLSEVSIHVHSRHYSVQIPDSVMTALQTKSGLELMTLSESTCSENLATLLDCHFFPILRYLALDISSLDRCIDFSKIPQLTVLKLSSRYASFEGSLNLDCLPDLKALDLSIYNCAMGGRKSVCDLGEERTQLWWLRVHGGTEIRGNLSTVTHLSLNSFFDASDLQQIVSACSNLTQLSVCGARANELTVPCSVSRLILTYCDFGCLELPENETFDVVYLKNVAIAIVPPRLQATHLCVAFTSDERRHGSLSFVRNLAANPSVLGSPKSLAIIANVSPSPSDVLYSLMEHATIRKCLEFFATNIPLTRPLLPMSGIRALCLGRFADIRYIEALWHCEPLAKLIVLGEQEPTVISLEDLRLTQVTESLIVPVDQDIPANLGVQVSKSLYRPNHEHAYDRYSPLWAVHVEQETANRLDIDHRDLCLTL